MIKTLVLNAYTGVIYKDIDYTPIQVGDYVKIKHKEKKVLKVVYDLGCMIHLVYV